MEINASYNDSRVTSDKYYNPSAATSALYVEPGERLPYVAYFNWSGNIRYEAPIKDALHGYVQYDVAHKGDMWNDLQTNGIEWSAARAAARAIRS